MSRISKKAILFIEETASLGNTYVVASGVYKHEISIGAHSYFRSGELICVKGIGRFCSIGNGVIIGQDPRNHPIDWVSSSHALCVDYISSPAMTNVGNDVWIGDDAVIMAGLEIGNGAIIGRGALVTKNVEPYEIVGGNPAKNIRYRFEQATRESLMASEWWMKDLEELKALNYADVGVFLSDLNKVSKLGKYRSIKIERQHVYGHVNN